MSSKNGLSVARCHAVGQTGNCSLVRLRLRAKHGGRVHIRVRSLNRPIINSTHCNYRASPLKHLTLRTFGLYFCRPLANRQVRFRAPCPTPFGGLVLEGWGRCVVGGLVFSFKKIVTPVDHRRTIRTFHRLKITSTSRHLSGCRRAKVFRRLRRKGVAPSRFRIGLKRLYNKHAPD